MIESIILALIISLFSLAGFAAGFFLGRSVSATGPEPLRLPPQLAAKLKPRPALVAGFTGPVRPMAPKDLAISREVEAIGKAVEP